MLAATFKRVLLDAEPELVEHLDGLGCEALGIALPWILTAFVGVLSVREVLNLWDRVIGFDTLLVRCCGLSLRKLWAMPGRAAIGGLRYGSLGSMPYSTAVDAGRIMVPGVCRGNDGSCQHSARLLHFKDLFRHDLQHMQK
jgi:hypothetical protein